MSTFNLELINAPVQVSVLMSVFDGARYIRESIESILGQTFDNFEFIIVDDASSDENSCNT